MELFQEIRESDVNGLLESDHRNCWGSYRAGGEWSYELSEGREQVSGVHKDAILITPSHT